MDPHNLRLRRVALGMSQEELAEKIGVPQNTLSRWENGVSEPRNPRDLNLFLEELEVAYLDVIDQCISLADTEEELAGTTDVTLYIYWSDEAFTKACPELRSRRITASIHRQACAHAALYLRDDGFSVTLRDGEQ